MTRKPWADQGSRHARGYGSAWDKARAERLKLDRYLCQPCLREARITPATQVDHVKPKAMGGTDDRDNLQAICKPCHEAKTKVEQGYTPKLRIGVDGWPV